MLRDFARGYGDAGVPTYPALLDRSADDPPNSYRMTGPQRALARELSHGMVALAAQLEAADRNARPDTGAPQPTCDSPADADGPAAPAHGRLAPRPGP